MLQSLTKDKDGVDGSKIYLYELGCSFYFNNIIVICKNYFIFLKQYIVL
jgi:hypothetical protein